MIFANQSLDQPNSKYMLVNLSLPKFDIKASGDLKEDLQAIGITDVFSPETADFSGTLYDHRDFDEFNPYISAVNQATRVCIDEKGVTAASYIELNFGAGAAEPPDEIIDFVLDRPFVFVVSREQIPLFVGTVNTP
jgi:serine protease inhibitor